jgi:N-sulfoglucosamine sulfohydrolase
VEDLTENTFVTLQDEDAGPMKAWLVTRRADPKWKPFFDRAYGKRPREELYDLKADPFQVNNVAADVRYAKSRADLEKRLMDELKRTKDPRLIEDGKFFETEPMAGRASEESRPKKQKAKSNP